MPCCWHIYPIYHGVVFHLVFSVLQCVHFQRLAFSKDINRATSTNGARFIDSIGLLPLSANQPRSSILRYSARHPDRAKASSLRLTASLNASCSAARVFVSRERGLKPGCSNIQRQSGSCRTAASAWLKKNPRPAPCQRLFPGNARCGAR